MAGNGLRSGRQPRTPGRHEVSVQLAVEPSGRVVNIAHPAVLADWHGLGRPGLTCLLCRPKAHVHIRRSPTGRYHLVHEINPDEHHANVVTHAGIAETYEHWLLKTWVRDWLTDNGWDARNELVLPGGGKPDVSAERSQDGVIVDRVAVEIQGSVMPRGADDERSPEVRTRRLQSDGYRVLWLAIRREWSLIDRVPAVDVGHAYDPDRRFRRTEIGGRYYWIHIGRLGMSADPSASGSARLVSGLRRPALETFVRDFSEGKVTWMSHTPGHAGWADEQQWRQHVEACVNEAAIQQRRASKLAADLDAADARLAQVQRQAAADLEQHRAELEGERSRHEQREADLLADAQLHTDQSSDRVHQLEQSLSAATANLDAAHRELFSARQELFGAQLRVQLATAALRGGRKQRRRAREQLGPNPTGEHAAVPPA